METVGTGLDHHIDDAALEVSKLGGGVVGDHFEFRDGVQVWLVGRQVIRSLVVVHAIQKEVVAFLPIAVHIGTPATRRTHSVVETGGVRRGYSWSQQSQGDRVTADERSVDDRLRGNH